MRHRLTNIPFVISAFVTIALMHQPVSFDVEEVAVLSDYKISGRRAFFRGVMWVRRLDGGLQINLPEEPWVENLTRKGKEDLTDCQ